MNITRKESIWDTLRQVVGLIFRTVELAKTLLPFPRLIKQRARQCDLPKAAQPLWEPIVPPFYIFFFFGTFEAPTQSRSDWLRIQKSKITSGGLYPIDLNYPGESWSPVISKQSCLYIGPLPFVYWASALCYLLPEVRD